MKRDILFKNFYLYHIGDALHYLLSSFLQNKLQFVVIINYIISSVILLSVRHPNIDLMFYNCSFIITYVKSFATNDPGVLAQGT